MENTLCVTDHVRQFASTTKNFKYIYTGSVYTELFLSNAIFGSVSILTLILHGVGTTNKAQCAVLSPDLLNTPTEFPYKELFLPRRSFTG